MENMTKTIFVAVLCLAVVDLGQGFFPEWGEWSNCDATCGEGIKTRTRTRESCCMTLSLECMLCLMGEYDLVETSSCESCGVSCGCGLPDYSFIDGESSCIHVVMCQK